MISLLLNLYSPLPFSWINKRIISIAIVGFIHRPKKVIYTNKGMVFEFEFKNPKQASNKLYWINTRFAWWLASSKMMANNFIARRGLSTAQHKELMKCLEETALQVK